MKKAISYKRISTKDQSNFSIDGQESIIQDFASKRDIEIIASFSDEGASARNFDRPDWQELEKFIRNNHSVVDFLIVAKYDRFSRKLAEALTKIETLESEFSLVVLSALEPIGLHPKSPYFFHFRAQILMGAQMEWHTLKERTSMGVYQACKSGRVVNRAPYGYLNSRDDKNKPIIIQDPARVHVIREIFRLYLEGTPLEAIRKRVKPMGFDREGNSIIKKILLNPIYAGLVRVPAYYDEPETIVDGIHNPIIEQDVYWRAQRLLQGRTGQRRQVLHADFPLRGVLMDKHGCPLTGGNSKGKNIYVGYYKCQKHKQYFNSKRIHEQLDRILEQLSLPGFYVEYIRKKTLEVLEQQLEEQQNLLKSKQAELHNTVTKLFGVEEKFISDQIDLETYERWRSKLIGEKASLEAQVSRLRQPQAMLKQRFEESVHLLGDLRGLYNIAGIPEKQQIIRQVFNSQLWYENGAYRTHFILPAFRLKAGSLADQGLLYYEPTGAELANSADCREIGSQIEPFLDLLNLLVTISKTA